MSNNEKKEGGIIFKGKTEAIYKVIVIGDPAVGKTSLLTNFATNQFEELCVSQYLHSSHYPDPHTPGPSGSTRPPPPP